MGEIIESKMPTGRELTTALRRMLRAQIPDLDRVLADLGQIAAAERRAAKGAFTFREHVRGLLLAQLSNQRPWLPIARMLPEIEQALLGFDPDALEQADPEELTYSLRRLRAGNRSLAAQMRGLASNPQAALLVGRSGWLRGAQQLRPEHAAGARATRSWRT